MQEPWKKFEFQPNSDRNTLAGKPVQWATTQAPDPRYASVSPSIVTRNQWPQSSGLQQKVEQFASYATPPQVSDKPWSIAETPIQYGGASKIWQIAWFNTQIAPWVKSFQEDTDFVYTPVQETVKIENDPTQSIADFIATLDAKPEITEQDIQTKFPEFIGKEQALADLIATMEAKPELTQEEIQAKFPELYATDVQDKLGSIELDKKQAERNPFLDFLGKTWADIKTRFTRIKEDIKDSIKDIQERPEFIESEIQQSLFRIVGEWAGFVGNDIITNLVQSIASPKWVNAFNKWVERIVEKLNNTGYGKAAIDLLSQWAGAYQWLESTNPELKKDIDAIVNIASIIPIWKGTKIAWEAIQWTNIAQSIGKQIDTMLPWKKNIELVKPDIRSKVEIKLTPKIEDKIQKAIKPTVIEKKGSNILQKFNNDVVKSIDTVQYYADQIQLKGEAWELTNRPIQSIKDFGDAIFQSKKYLYDEYNSIKTQAWGKGLEIELSDTISELQKSKAKLQRLPWQKQAIAYIDDQIDDLTTIGKLSVDDAQSAMQIYNEKLDAFYRNPQPNDVGKASIDALINNSIRNNMNKWIELATWWPEYQVLKDRYRALMNIEKEVMKRAIVSGRQNAKSLLDFSDLFTADQAIGAIVNIASGNIPWAVKNTLSAVFVNGLKNMYKKINSPDTNLRELFEIVSKDRPNILQPKKIDDTIIDSVNMPDNSLQGMGLTKKWQEQFVAWPQQLWLPEKSQGYNIGTKENPIIWKSPGWTILRRVQDKAEFIEKPQGEKPKQDILSRAITKAKAKTVKDKLIAPEKTPDVVQQDIVKDVVSPKQASSIEKEILDITKEYWSVSYKSMATWKLYLHADIKEAIGKIDWMKEWMESKWLSSEEDFAKYISKKNKEVRKPIVLQQKKEVAETKKQIFNEWMERKLQEANIIKKWETPLQDISKKIGSKVEKLYGIARSLDKDTFVKQFTEQFDWDIRWDMEIWGNKIDRVSLYGQLDRIYKWDVNTPKEAALKIWDDSQSILPKAIDKVKNKKLPPKIPKELPAKQKIADTPLSNLKNPKKSVQSDTLVSKSDSMSNKNIWKYIEGEILPTNNKEYSQVFTSEKKIDEKTTKMATIKVLDKKWKVIDEFSFSRSPRSEKEIQNMTDAIIYDDIIKKSKFDTENLWNFKKVISWEKPQISKDLQPLYTEAKKYKSAEEFIKWLEKDWKIMYHGTWKEKFTKFKVTTKDIFDNSWIERPVFLTPSKEIARMPYAWWSDSRVMAVIDKSSNPFDFDKLFWEWKYFEDQIANTKLWKELMSDLESWKLFSKATDWWDNISDVLKDISNGEPTAIEQAEFIKWMKNKWYDSFYTREHGVKNKWVFNIDDLDIIEPSKIREEANKKQ